MSFEATDFRHILHLCSFRLINLQIRPVSDFSWSIIVLM